MCSLVLSNKYIYIYWQSKMGIIIVIITVKVTEITIIYSNR